MAWKIERDDALMWLGKFLDLKEDLKTLSTELKTKMFEGIKKTKLTPLEFTILENIFNSQEKGLYGYDLIESLNEHFAGTWEARSGTIYPILSKLKRDGFLDRKMVKSPLGPIQKVYALTDAGERIIKRKINVNFLDQITFMRNFIIELATIYLTTIPVEERKEGTAEVYDLIERAFEKIKMSISKDGGYKVKCPNCQEEMDRRGSAYCSFCGTSLVSGDDLKEDEFEPAENI